MDLPLFLCLNYTINRRICQWVLRNFLQFLKKFFCGFYYFKALKWIAITACTYEHMFAFICEAKRTTSVDVVRKHHAPLVGVFLATAEGVAYIVSEDDGSYSAVDVLNIEFVHSHLPLSYLLRRRRNTLSNSSVVRGLPLSSSHSTR